jgi:hypothetical protein
MFKSLRNKINKRRNRKAAFEAARKMAEKTGANLGDRSVVDERLSDLATQCSCEVEKDYDLRTTVLVVAIGEEMEGGEETGIRTKVAMHDGCKDTRDSYLVGRSLIHIGLSVMAMAEEYSVELAKEDGAGDFDLESIRRKIRDVCKDMIYDDNVVLTATETAENLVRRYVGEPVKTHS